tara:strand:+ start:4152 stop:4331 length:180 start_codon:yes stop_codon:yes gene_type:complete
MSDKMPCRITDDPYYDYSDWLEGEGVFKQHEEEDPDDAYERWVSEQLDKEEEKENDNRN